MPGCASADSNAKPTIRPGLPSASKRDQGCKQKREAAKLIGALAPKAWPVKHARREPARPPWQASNRGVPWIDRESHCSRFTVTAVQGAGRRAGGLTASGYAHLPPTAKLSGHPDPRATSRLSQLRRHPPYPSDFPPLPMSHPMLSRGRRGLGFPCRGHPPSSSAATRTTTSRQVAARIER